jgi:hypothetical protein
VRTRLSKWGAATGIVLGALLATAAQAQPPIKPAVEDRDDSKRAGVHRMEIYNGASRTVRYFGRNLSAGDLGSLRDLERLENELSYIEDLQALKTMYISNERVLEMHRRFVQQELYGVDISTTDYEGLGYGRWGGLGYYSAYPFGVSYGAYAGFWPGFSGFAGSTSTVTRSLATGVGNEGAIKTAMASAMARQATPEYAASIERGLDRAMAQAAGSSAIRPALGVSDRPAKAPAAPAVTVKLKSGEELAGTKVEETKDWVIVDLVGGGQEKVRAAEVMRIRMAKAAKPKPPEDE